MSPKTSQSRFLSIRCRSWYERRPSRSSSSSSIWARSGIAVLLVVVLLVLVGALAGLLGDLGVDVLLEPFADERIQLHLVGQEAEQDDPEALVIPAGLVLATLEDGAADPVI